jgi:hypothetical protein
MEAPENTRTVTLATNDGLIAAAERSQDTLVEGQASNQLSNGRLANAPREQNATQTLIACQGEGYRKKTNSQSGYKNMKTLKENVSRWGPTSSIP